MSLWNRAGWSGLLSLAMLLAAQTAAAAPGNVLVSRGRTEPVTAIDPRHPNTLFIATNTNYAAPLGDTLPLGLFASHDGGRSFSGTTTPIFRPYTTQADPSVAVAKDGTVFVLALGETPAFCSSGHSAVLLYHSTDGGRSFRSPTVIDTADADDKPNMAVRNVSGHRAQIFVTWNRDNGHNTDVWYARSLDGGASFSRPARLYGLRQDSWGPVPVVAPHGRVYVSWTAFPNASLTTTSSTQIMLRVSRDNGAHFGPIRNVAGTFYSVPHMAQPGALRNFTNPSMVADRHGALYIAWVAAAHNYGSGRVDADLHISRSLDGGQSWSRPARVNDRRAGDRFMPSMSVLPDGTIGLAWYDRRAGGASLGTYAARVGWSGGFHASSNVRLNRQSAPIDDITYIAPGSTCFAPGRFFGDYLGTAALPNGELCVTWADTQLHVSPETDIWFSRVRLPGAPSARR